MKRSSMWTIALASTTVLTTAVWAQHGGGAGGHGGPPSVAAHGQSHADETASTKDADKDSDRSADFESRLASNSKLSSRLQSLLPPKTTLEKAASGFKSQGQFIAALHVSHNLNIPFDQLKTDRMTQTRFTRRCHSEFASGPRLQEGHQQCDARRTSSQKGRAGI